jgi:hypothetical protein
LQEDQLAGAEWANTAADGSEHADHVVVGGVQLFVLLNENLRQEKEYKRRADEPAETCEAECDQKPETIEAREEVAGAAEPGEKRRNRSKVDWCDFAGTPASMGSMRVPANVKIDVGQVKMRASQKR